MLRVARVAVALVGAAQVVYFGYQAYVGICCTSHVDSLITGRPALLAVVALAGTLGTLMGRLWGAVLVAVASGGFLASEIVLGNLGSPPWWYGLWGLATVASIGVAVGLWRVPAPKTSLPMPPRDVNFEGLSAEATIGPPSPTRYRRPTRVLVAAQLLLVRGALGLIASLGLLLLSLAFRGEAVASVPSPSGLLTGFAVVVAIHAVLISAGVGLLGAKRWSTMVTAAALTGLVVTSVVALGHLIQRTGTRVSPSATELSEFLRFLGWTEFFFIFVIDVAITVFVAWAVLSARRLPLVLSEAEARPPTDVDRRRIRAAEVLLAALGVAALALPVIGIAVAIKRGEVGPDVDLGFVLSTFIPWSIPWLFAAVAALLTSRAVRQGRRWTLAGAPVAAVAVGTWIFLISWLAGGGGNPYGVAGMLAALGAGLGAAAGLWLGAGRLPLLGAGLGALTLGIAGFAAGRAEPGFGLAGWLLAAALLATVVFTAAAMTSGQAALGKAVT